MQVLSKRDLKHWIFTLYQDLCSKDVLIGGYYFKPSNLDKMIEYYLTKKLDEDGQLLEEHKTHTKNPKLAKPATSALIISTFSKEHESKVFPVMEEEYICILDELQRKKDIIDLFLHFCIDELKEVENPDEFSVFVNDYYEDTLREITRQESF